MLTLHCRARQSLRALWALFEANAAHRLVWDEADVRLEIAADEEGQPPAVIGESMAVLHYVAERFAPELLVRADEPDYAEFLNYVHRSHSTFGFPLTVVMRYAVDEPVHRRHAQVVDDYAQFAKGRLRVLEPRLDGRRFLAADRFTIADIGVGHALLCARLLNIDDIFTPNVQRYYQSIVDRPAFKKALQLDRNSTRPLIH